MWQSFPVDVEAFILNLRVGKGPKQAISVIVKTSDKQTLFRALGALQSISEKAVGKNEWDKLAAREAEHRRYLACLLGAVEGRQ